MIPSQRRELESRLAAAKDPKTLLALQARVLLNEDPMERGVLERDLREIRAASHGDPELRESLKKDLREAQRHKKHSAREVAAAQSGCMGARAFDTQQECFQLEKSLAAHAAAKSVREKQREERYTRVTVDGEEESSTIKGGGGAETDRQLEEEWDGEWSRKEAELQTRKDEVDGRLMILNSKLDAEKKVFAPLLSIYSNNW